MDDATREQMIKELEALRAQVKAGGASPSEKDVELQAHIASLHVIVTTTPAQSSTQKTAQALSQRLLAWEAEHPGLVALAARVARALEDSGL